MACVSGSNIVNDGLVFHFDLDNDAKSWKGKPTSNLIANPTFSSGAYSPWSYQTTDNGNVVLDTSVKYQGYNSVRITRTSTGGEANVWTNMYAVHGLLPNTEYTFSVWCLANKPNEAAIFTYFGTTSEGFVYHSGSGEWERLSHTFTTRATEPYIQLRMWHDTTTLNSPIWFTKLQVEEGPIASKWVDGIRLDTASIIDVSPTQSTITAANLTYRQDDTPTFDGTNDYFTLSDQSIPIYNTSYTIESWIKRSVTGANHGIIGDLQYDWFGLRITGANKVYIMHRQTDSEVNSLTGTSNIGTDWTHVAVVFDISSGMAIYVNGNLDATNTNLYYFGLTQSNRGPKYIGRNDSSSFGASTHYFNGEISKLVGYTRALSPTEVKQNFEASKTRYGL